MLDLYHFGVPGSDGEALEVLSLLVPLLPMALGGHSDRLYASMSVSPSISLMLRIALLSGLRGVSALRSFGVRGTWGGDTCIGMPMTELVDPTRFTPEGERTVSMHELRTSSDSDSGGE